MKALVSLVLLSSVLLLLGCSPIRLSADNDIINQPSLINQIDKTDNTTMTVISMNIAHGRKDKFHQAFLEDEEIKSNVDHIVKMSNREQPFLVALQEADGPSSWSGKFNHVEYISNQTGLKNYFQGYHVDKFGLQYGTAILSSNELHSSKSHTFDSRSIISLSKGFVLSTVKWPGEDNYYVDVISVHLDFLLDSVRQKQINELIAVLEERDNPVILMGDLNADSESDAIQSLIETLDLKAYKFKRDGLETFSRFNKRFDWILISKELEYVSYNVLPDDISDHSAIISEISLVREEDIELISAGIF
jgi:endonuclease/exonuclease/phosphatase family metal-dependent hydrolase